MARPKKEISIFTLADEFGVSAPTISKALSNSVEVSEALRSKVRSRAKALAFKPHRPRRKGYNICALLDMESNGTFQLGGYIGSIVEGIHAFCRDNGAEFSIYGDHTDRLSRIDLVRELHLRNADGAVILGASSQSPYFDKFEQNGFPFYCVFDGPDEATIKVDNRSAGRLACMHLLELGYRTLAVARHLDGRSASSERFLGFVQEVARNGPDVSVAELLPPMSEDRFLWGRSLVDAWERQGRPYRAVFSLGLNAAMGILSAAAEYGIRIPGELAVLSCDNIEISAHAAPPLSVVDTPNQKSGYLAASQVWKQLSGKEPQYNPYLLQHPLPVESVVHRAST